MKAEIKPPKATSSVRVDARDKDDKAAAVARLLTKPEFLAALTIEKWQSGTHDLNELVKELTAQVEAVNNGDIRRAEAMLIAQAQTLNEVFNNLMRRVVGQQSLKQWETYMRVGLKAQNQCRMALESLAEIKNPRPVAFVKQANIAHGPQQVNNGAGDPANGNSTRTRARATQSEPNKLLEAADVERLDTGAPGAAGGTHPSMEPLARLNGAENRSR